MARASPSVGDGRPDFFHANSRLPSLPRAPVTSLSDRFDEDLNPSVDWRSHLVPGSPEDDGASFSLDVTQGDHPRQHARLAHRIRLHLSKDASRVARRRLADVGPRFLAESTLPAPRNSRTCPPSRAIRRRAAEVVSWTSKDGGDRRRARQTENSRPRRSIRCSWSHTADRRASTPHPARDATPVDIC